MQFKFFTVPVYAVAEAEEELNRFLRGHRILSVERHLVADSSQSCWCFSIEYLEGSSATFTSSAGNKSKKKRIDYKEVLSDMEFTRFAKFREVRKKLAQEDAVPAFAVFLDEHLAELAKLEQVTLSDLKKVSGIGEKKLDKYGQRFIDCLSVGSE